MQKKKALLGFLFLRSLPLQRHIAACGQVKGSEIGLLQRDPAIPEHPELLRAAAGFNAAELLGSVGDARIDDLCKLVKAFPLNVTGVKGFDNAQVTVGGVLVSEFRADTLESRIAPGVFAAGEVLDIDGDCGGFNLQWAWSSGYVAGKLGKGGEDA